MFWKKIILFTRFLFGNGKIFSLEHRIFNSLALATTLTGIGATTINLILGLDKSLTFITGAASVLIIGTYLLSRFRKRFQLALIIYLILSFIVLSCAFFFNAGINGPVLLMYLSLFALLIAATKKYLRFAIILAFFINMIVLFYIDRNLPEMILPYSDPKLKHFDVFFSLVIACLMIVAFISYIMKSYNYERSLALKQHDRIKQQQVEIRSSIMYAKYIQNALLPRNNQLNRLLGEYFIFNKPRDIVSGDFYWVTKKDDIVVLAVSDCTGHGVPGGFMSMLGIAFLNEIVNKNGILEVDAILNQMRIQVIDALNQDNNQEQKDGMDMCIITIDSKQGKIKYAGANSPLFYVSNTIREDASFNNVDNNESYYLEEIKPDLMPVSFFHQLDGFTMKELNYKNGDVIYLGTDGFVDQYGGENKKKYGKKEFKQFLLSIAHKSMETQQVNLESEFRRWKGERQQIDDVLVVGLKLN